MLLLLSAAWAVSPVHPAHTADMSALSADDLVLSLEDHLAHGAKCVTPIARQIRDRADELSPSARARATELLTPWKADLREPLRPLRDTPPPPDAMATEPCFSAGENRLTSENFAVEWDGNTIDEDTAQDFLDALEDGYRVQVGELGWKEPMGDGRYLLLAYVASGNYQGAYTTVDYCGSALLPYIVAYAGSFSSRSWADTMAVHEFNHAVQFSYGFAWEFWWWEATATYIESQVYPSSDWWAYYVSGYSQNPHLAFNASDQDDQDIFWHMYGMAIWAAYVDENLGGHETVLATWEAADDERGTYTFGMWDAFEELDLDFDAAYQDFAVKNTVMAYEAQRVLPDVDERNPIDELPHDDEVDGSTRPQGYGQTYTRIEAGVGEGDLRVTFAGDEDARWSVQLVEVDRTAVLRVAQADVVDGAGEVTLAGFGAEDVVLVVSPLEEDDKKYGYSFTAEIVERAGDTPGGDDSGNVDGDTPGDEDPVELGGCACDTGASPGALGLGALLGLAAIARRRR